MEGNEVNQVNIWRAWDTNLDAPVYLVALYDPDSGRYTRKLNSQERRLFGVESITGLFHRFLNFITVHRPQAHVTANNLYGWATMGDALLRSDERSAGFAPMVRGKRVAKTGAIDEEEA